MTSTKTYCRHAKDIPSGDHYVIIDFKSITIPGVEHIRFEIELYGYSSYISFTDRAEWEKEISERTHKNDFVALRVTRAKIEVATKVVVTAYSDQDA